MENTESKQKINMRYVSGIFILSISLQFANYGPPMAIPAKLAGMDGMSYYALVSALATVGMMLILPMVGKLYAIFSMRTVILAGIAIQLAARIGCMLAPSVLPLMIVYVIQSIGGGMYASATYVLMAGAVPGKDRPKFYGYITTSNAIGALLGPLVCGWLVDIGLRDFAFIAYFPLSVIAIICIFRFVPKQKTAGAAAGFDFFGVVLLVAAISCIILWMNLGGKNFAWSSITSIVMILVGIVALTCLIRRELTIDNPAVPLRMFQKKRLRTAFLVQFCISSYITCSGAYIVVYIQQVLLSGNATISGTAMMPQTIVTAVLGIFIGRYLGKNFAKRFRPVGILASLCAIAATLLMFLLTPESSMLQIWIATGIGGICVAVGSSYAAFFQSELKPEEYPPAQALFQFGATSGSALFGALAGILLNSGASLNQVFLVAAGVCTLGLIFALFGFRFSKEEIAASSAAAATK